MRPAVDAFQAKHPFIKTAYWRADSADIVEKVAAEVRAEFLHNLHRRESTARKARRIGNLG